MTTTGIEKFTEAQLEKLRAEYGRFEKVGAAFLPKFRAIFDKCGDDALRQLAHDKIKFLSKLAVNACIRRGVRLA